MRAVCEGAYKAGEASSIGILPNDKQHPLEKYPNEFVDISIFTGMYDARNVINAKTPYVLVALSGGAGTLSGNCPRAANGIPVVGLHAPTFKISGKHDFVAVNTVEEVLRKLREDLSNNRSWAACNLRDGMSLREYSMVQWNSLLIVFLVLFIAGALFRGFLTYLNVRHLRQHG